MMPFQTKTKRILSDAGLTPIFEAKFPEFIVSSQFLSAKIKYFLQAKFPSKKGMIYRAFLLRKRIPSVLFTVFIFSSILILFQSCSQEKRTWTSLAWHNTLAHYNGYFIAREKMKEYETAQLVGHKDNYNKILDIYPFPPLGAATAANTTMEEIIKKASIPIQRHKNSDWVDDCYQLIGQARFYKEDWENALQTFKFINTKFKDNNSKHKAVIWLLITYTRMGDYSNAKSVIAYLKKETLSKANLREGALAFAYYYQKKKEYAKMADYLAMGVELMPRGKRKGRLNYALGQLHQRFNRESDAYASFREVLKNRPTFELEFYTRLSLAQVVEITNEKQLKKIRKNFKRMTTDLKYEDYLDRVYYEMGMFEVKQNNMDKGLSLLRTSLKKSKSTTGQKPYTYMKLAELHYKPLRSYVWAKNYYDSCVKGLDTTDDNYKFVAKRFKVLEEFVVHYQTIQREDSLLRLSRMDSTQLYALVDGMIAADKEKKRKDDALAKKMASGGGSGGDAAYNSAFDNLKGGPGGTSPTPGGGGGGWYFSNLAAVAAGRSDFKKKWGERKLEDNWRRSTKETQFSDDDPAANADSTKDKKPGDTAKGGATDQKVEKSGTETKEVELSQNQLRQQYLKDLPAGEAGVKASNDKIMVALLEVGKIYDQKLEEPLLAAEALERDVKDYPNFEKRPEALYNLCLIYRRLNREPDFERCKKILLADHSESVFAKLILNPNYLLDNKQRNEIIATYYKKVFDQYKAKQFIEASNGITNIRTQFPKSDFEDKLAILSALITAKTVDIPSYKLALNKFLVDFPKSDLQDFAKRCLENIDKINGGKAVPAVDSSALAVQSKAPTFNANLDQPTIFLALIPSLDIPESDILASFSDFNTKFYPGDELSVTSLPFSDNKHSMIKIQELPSKIQGMYFIKKVQEAGPFKKEFKNLKPIYLLITQENLQILYRNKAISEYVTFYNKNYNLTKELDDDIPGFSK